MLRFALPDGRRRLSNRARTGEFARLTDAEVARFEQLYQECFIEHDIA
jgi:hypothetical protein